MQEGVTELEYEGKKSKSTCTCIPRVFWEMVAFSSRDNKSWKSNKPMFNVQIRGSLCAHHFAVCEQGQMSQAFFNAFFFFLPDEDIMM